MALEKSEDWLARYANNHHAWKIDIVNGRKVYKRPLGLVEYSFDTDGTVYEGRADMNALLTLEIRHFLSKDDFRRRIALAWASLRLQHVMLQSRVLEDESRNRHFVIETQASLDEVLKKSLDSIVWIEDYYDEVDDQELHRHCLNVARIIDPSQCLSRLHVLPLVKLTNGNFELRVLIILAHQISDGLSSYNWLSHFIRILNMPGPEIEREINVFRSTQSMVSRLPPAQEDLYPPIAGNKARQRWFWAIMRVLRHVRKTPPPTFINPLRREQRLSEAISLPPTFSKLFDYSSSRKPPMNSFNCSVSLSAHASTRLISLCRSANISIGAGCFALAGISMMEMYEASQSLHFSNSSYASFAASFPLNPRAFFGFTTPADSCMLAFSDGIVMPFLPSSLPIEGRFKLVAKQANRELRVYQKRLKGKNAEAVMNLDSHSPSRLLANAYLFQLEVVEAKLPTHRKTGINPQGELPAKRFASGATCGVSSVGSTASFFRAGMHDLDVDVENDFAADYRGMKMGVRARENEFLVGSSTDWRGIVGFGVSFDGNAISEEKAEEWAEKIRGLLEEKEKRSRL